MTCADLEILICDYVDGALAGSERASERASLERHLASCAACAELARDAADGLRFLEQAGPVEPPPELLTRILFEMRSARPPVANPGRFRSWLSNLMRPLLQPRLVMGMALTILSFSMLARFVGVPVRQLTPADLNPASVWSALDDRAHRVWQRTLKFYESIRFVYEIQLRLREWQEQQDAAAAPADERLPPASTAAESASETEKSR